MVRAAFVFALTASAVSAQLSGQDTALATQSPTNAQVQGQAAPSSANPSPALSSASPTPAATGKQTSPRETIDTGKPIRADSLHAQRKAAKLYLLGVRLLEKQRPEEAWGLLKQAVQLQPTNATYLKAAELARQSAVTQLVQQSSRERGGGATQDAAELLQDALSIDPTNPLVLDHIRQMADAAGAALVGEQASTTLGAVAGTASDEKALAEGPIQLQPKLDKHSFHLRDTQHQLVQDVFHAYGIETSIHESVGSKQERLDVDDATFAEATQVLGLLTQTFYEPLDPHRVVVAKDNRENRTLFQREQIETIYLPGLNDKDLTEAGNVAKNVFEAQQAITEPSKGTLTIRAPAKTLAAFNQTMAGLEDGRSQVNLDVKVIQLSHIASRETGTTFFQQTGVYNVYSEIQSVLSQNQSLVQQIISSGLVPNANTLANQIEILAILVASGQLTGTPFNQGFLPFGGGLTQSILSPGPATLTMTLNTSDTRVLDDIQMQLGDQEEGTFKVGERYPIETSSFSSVALPNIPGLSSAVTSAASQTIPQVQYEDIGLTFKATPKVMRSNDVALNIDLKIVALGGTSLNDIPILDNQSVSGVLTMKAGETAVMLSNLSKSESRALSGLPGVGDIPGLQDISDITKDQNVARLLILVTPSVIRNVQAPGHGPILMVDKPANSH